LQSQKPEKDTIESYKLLSGHNAGEALPSRPVAALDGQTDKNRMEPIAPLKPTLLDEMQVSAQLLVLGKRICALRCGHINLSKRAR
jgi:hypothetical protein